MVDQQVQRNTWWTYILSAQNKIRSNGETCSCHYDGHTTAPEPRREFSTLPEREFSTPPGLTPPRPKDVRQIPGTGVH
eukprot:4157123-Amphidinium_carterae.1